ncbi:uncharacterized protein LOC123664559 [Melitaea cinxia]|uniref:uncharacterized protein LOC123664559 n=1 Tax=Melitaea cinxia TaxID=113334 RepID=UPI001E270976|nr:uncharacterized protein LOC123664559 [Melitaea cinxia]
MEGQFQILFDKMKIEMQNQTKEVTDTIMEKIDEKLKPILEENKILKNKIENLEKKVEYLKRDKKSNNIIIHGLNEDEKSIPDLLNKVKKHFLDELNLKLEDWEVNKIYRIGKSNNNNKPRPTVLVLVCGWKKSEIMRNKKKLRELYITEDYSKETLEKRKALQSKVAEERKKGNFAFIKYDKLVVKKNPNTNDKRKRQTSNSPKEDAQPRKQQTLNSSESNRKNAFDMMRMRSNSFSTSFNTTKQ